jgi:hypothetical protein
LSETSEEVMVDRVKTTNPNPLPAAQAA